MIKSLFQFLLSRLFKQINYSLYSENAIAWALKNQKNSSYQFKCLAFVEDAYEQSNNLEMFGEDCAYDSALLYGVIKTGVPPRGAFVFYSAEGPINGIKKNWGHVGLSLGDGNVIHVWNVIRIDNYRDIENLSSAPGWNSPCYLGWTSPKVFLKGCIFKLH